MASPASTSCPVCSASAPQGARFCPECGARLTPALPVPEERKTVTVLFCDLVGFTAMSENADPEDIDACLRAFAALAREVIERYGGSVEKFIGDAVVGIFGVPAVHEDDPERAVRCALAAARGRRGIVPARRQFPAGAGRGQDRRAAGDLGLRPGVR